MKVAHWLVPLLTLSLAGVVTLWEFDQRVAPGPLHPAHQGREELLGTAGCQRCHGSGTGVVDADACGVCHVAVHAQLGTERGVHGSLPGSQARACAPCHSEHHGASTRLLTAHSFALAGVPDVSKYEHAHIPGFGLSGSHARLACSACHAHAADPSPPPTRYLGLTQTCTSCHEDPHRGNLGVGCAECHGQEGAFRAAPSFRHEALPLRDGHAAVACAKCHVEGEAHGVAALRTTPQRARACNQCHVDPHVAAAEGRRSPSLGNVDTQECARCHAATRWRDATVNAATHAELGFALTPPHDEVACARCHAGADRVARFPGRAPADCRACHRDPHAGQFDHEPRYAQCTACHAAERFTPPSFDLAAHARTSFPLTGAHEGVGCTLCHDRGREDVRTFHGTAMDCAACHADPHLAQFAVLGRTDCARCHGETSFAVSHFDHQQNSTFRLDETHRTLACVQCHRSTVVGGRKVVKYKPIGVGCGDCHVLDHGKVRR